MRSGRAHIIAWTWTIALCSSGAARADGTSPTIIVYAPDSSTVPLYRIWNGQTWGAPLAAPATVGYAHWIVAKNSPARNETAAAFYGHTRELTLSFYDGTVWSSAQSLGTNVGVNHAQRGFDLVYENSGDVLVAWWDSASSQIVSRSGGSSALGTERSLQLGSTAGVRWVRMVPQPATNRVLLLALNDDEELHAAFWTGAAWRNAVELSTTLSEDTTKCFAAAFESQSRDGLIVYASTGSSLLRYRTTTGSTFSPEQSGPDMVSSDIRWVRSAGSPTSNEIIIVTLGADLTLNAVVWDGSAFGTPVQVASGLQFSDRQQFDIAWQPDGARALLVHTQSGVGTIRWRTFTGGNWGTTTSGSNGGSTNALFTLMPATSGSGIFGAFYGTDNDLFASHWNGSSLPAHADLNGTIEGMQRCQAFMVVPASVALPQAEPDEPDGQLKRVVNWHESDPR